MLIKSSDHRPQQPPLGKAGVRFRALPGILFALVLGLALCAYASGPKRAPSGAPSGAKRDAGKPKEAAAAPMSGSSTAPRLDSAKIHTLYIEGEFDEAIAVLEANLRDPRQYDHNDSVFIYKHLGVMYAANESTREKGRYYMHRLLLVEPTAKIMDMYASDMIYTIFKNIQEEYQASHSRPARTDTAQAIARPVARTHEPATVEEKPKGSSGYVWLGAAAVAVAAGAATWFYMNDEKPKVVVQDHQP
jgi:hypothetical protein